MNTGRIIIAGILGGIVAFLLGWVFYGMLLMDFFTENAGSASGVMRAEDEMGYVPLMVGNIAWGLLFAVVLARRNGGVGTFGGGLKVGALLGFLIAVAYDLISLGTTHIMNTNGVLADIVLGTVMSALIGGVVAPVLGRGKQ